MLLIYSENEFFFEPFFNFLSPGRNLVLDFYILIFLTIIKFLKLPTKDNTSKINELYEVEKYDKI